MGEYDKAIEHYKKLSSCCFEEEAVLYHIGVAYFEAGRLTEAIQSLKHAIEVNPLSKRAKKMLDYITDTGEF